MKSLLVLLGLLPALACAQNGTDVYLMRVTSANGIPALSDPANISNKTGYDNQPFFHPSKPLLYYTSMMPDNQTDIMVYDLSTGTRTQLTKTPDSEYSPTVLPNQRDLSCIVQRKASGDQDLVAYSLADPNTTRLIFASQKTGKIGYQAWINDNEAVAFVLGEPNALHYFDLKAGTDAVIAPQIGRSLHKIPGRNTFSFVQQTGNRWIVREFDPKTKKLTDLTDSDPDSEHYNAWTPDGMLLESRGTQLWAFTPKTKVWTRVPLPADLPAKKISRLAVRDGFLAIVLDE
ncbi:hypothetical protein [Arsenicibacter rosenii]|nr:hypothetical protein [Arsenicibacter rosenii]